MPLEDLVAELCERSAGLEPEVLHGSSAVDLLESFARGERAASVAVARLARRVGDTNGWRRDGHRSVEEFVAQRTGTTPGQAARRIRTGRRLDELPATREEASTGGLSFEQTEAIAEAAALDPDAEGRLLETAARTSLRGLRREASRVKAAVEDDTERDRRVRERRRLRSVERDGGVAVEGFGPIDEWVDVLAALRPFQQAAFDRARREGAREPLDAYRWDALVGMCRSVLAGDISPEGAGRSAKAETLIIADYDAWRTGANQSGRTVEVHGIGPVPVAVAKRMAEDSVIRFVVRWGTDLATVCTTSRHVNPELRAALYARSWGTCEVPGCEHTAYLEMDHVLDHALHGPTALWNLDLLCSHHHAQKTRDRHRLVGDPGDRRWLDDTGRILSADRPRHHRHGRLDHTAQTSQTSQTSQMSQMSQTTEVSRSTEVTDASRAHSSREPRPPP